MRDRRRTTEDGARAGLGHARGSAPVRPVIGLLQLQAAAGNQAVASLFVQRQAAEAEIGLDQLGYTAEDLADSEPASSGSSGSSSGAAESVQRLAAGHTALVQRSAEPVLQRFPGRCPPYDGYSATVPIESYNCAGLAHRTYDRKPLAATRALLSAGVPASGAPAGHIKHWLWTYDLSFEESSGARTPASPDFHTVAGEIRPGGADPTQVFSKNGRRPIYGPATGPSFRPAAREPARVNSAAQPPATDSTGRPLYAIRENMVEATVALPCPSTTPPLQGPPPPP